MTLWYVIQVQTRREAETAKKCQEEAARGNDRIFSMMSERLMRQKDGTWEESEQPAFPSYIFAETDDIDGLRMRLRTVKMMTSVLKAGNDVKPIYPEEEELLRNLGGEEHVIRVSEGFRSGERLVVTAGPMKGYEGMVKWSKAHHKVAAIEVELLGQKVTVKLGFEFLKKA